MRPRDLVRHARAIAGAKPARLRGALLAAGVELALDGYPAEAAALFDRALVEPAHPHDSLHLGPAVAGLRLALGVERSPAARRAAAGADARLRAELLGDRWATQPPAPSDGKVPARLDAAKQVAWFRRAIAARSEARRDEILAALARDPGLIGYLRDDVLLLVADAQARSGAAEAAATLAAWRAQAGSFAERALILQPLAAIIGSGALRAWSGLTPRDVETFVRDARGGAAAPRSATATRHTITTLYNQFYLESRRPPGGEPYFADAGDHQRGFSLRGGAVALSTPTECESVEVALRVAPPPADLGRAARVCRFPLMATGELYLRGVGDGADDHRFAVPDGAYAVTAAFRKKRGKGGLDRYAVDLWLAAGGATSGAAARPGGRRGGARR